MKLPIHPSSRDGNLGMMPMIDVVFLLLVFFIWTSSFDAPEFDLPGSIAIPPPKVATAKAPSDDAPVAEPFDEIVIRLLDVDGVINYRLNDMPMSDLAQLQRRLADILALGVSPPVIVDPDPEIEMAPCVAVYDSARLAGADRVLFAARADDPT